MAEHWAYWVPIVVLGLSVLITWLTARYQEKNGKINVLVKVFIFLRTFMQELEKVTQDGDLTKEEIVTCITTALTELRNMLGEIQETFDVGDTAKLEEAKEEIIGEENLSWRDTEKVLTTKKANSSKLKAVKESLKFKRR